MDLTSQHVRGAVGGSRGSLEWVIAHFDPLLETQIRMRLRGTSTNEDDVQDLRSETWVVVLQKLSELQPREGRYAPVLARFLSTTALNLCGNLLRQKIRRRLVAPDRAEPSSATRVSMDRFSAHTLDALQRACQADERRRIATALAGLPADARDVLVLRLLDQRSNQDIAAQLGQQPNTVAVRYKRALEKLRAQLAGDAFEELWSLHRFREEV